MRLALFALVLALASPAEAQLGAALGDPGRAGDSRDEGSGERVSRESSGDASGDGAASEGAATDRASGDAVSEAASSGEASSEGASSGEASGEGASRDAASSEGVSGDAVSGEGVSSAVSSDGSSLGRALADPDRVLEPADAEPDAREVAPEAPWPGPQIQLGYSYYRLSDGYGGGDVSAGGAEVFVQFPWPELRVGLLAEAGARDYALGGDDLIVRGALELGFQLAHVLDPFVPHASLLVSFGGVVSKRFESTIAHAFGGAGLALGGEVRVVRNLHLGAQVSYQRLEMDGAAYDVFMIRLFAGL